MKTPLTSRDPCRPPRWPRGWRGLRRHFPPAPNWRSRPTCVAVWRYRPSWCGVRPPRQSTASAVSVLLRCVSVRRREIDIGHDRIGMPGLGQHLANAQTDQKYHDEANDNDGRLGALTRSPQLLVQQFLVAFIHRDYL